MPGGPQNGRMPTGPGGMGSQFIIPGGPQVGPGFGQNPPHIDQVTQDADNLYVVQGLTIYKVSKKEMAIKGKVSIPGPFQDPGYFNRWGNGRGQFEGGLGQVPVPLPPHSAHPTTKGKPSSVNGQSDLPN